MLLYRLQNLSSCCSMHTEQCNEKKITQRFSFRKIQMQLLLPVGLIILKIQTRNSAVLQILFNLNIRRYLNRQKNGNFFSNYDLRQMNNYKYYSLSL